MNSQYEFMQNSLKNSQNFNITKEDIQTNNQGENHRYENLEQQIEKTNADNKDKEQHQQINKNLKLNDEEDGNYGSQEFTNNS
jgi:hypothetical protein